MLRRWLQRYGVLQMTVGFTVVSILMSVCLTSGLLMLLVGKIDGIGISISIIVPAIVAPLFTYILLRLLHQLDFAERKLLALTRIDDLTGAFNRRYFMELAEVEFAQARRYGSVFSVLLCDVDHFKRVNDRYGHLVGDEMLRVLAEVCKACIRETDVFARYGGEEFVILLPQTDADKALMLAERLRKSTEETAIRTSHGSVTVTISVGIACWRPDTASLDEVLKAADEALYAAKAGGRNRVIIAR